MVHQLEFAREGGTTIWANEWIHRPMETRVHNQMFFLGEAFSTILTNVRSFTGVKLAVCHQMALQWKRATTFLAHERALTAVDT